MKKNYYKNRESPQDDELEIKSDQKKLIFPKIYVLFYYLAGLIALIVAVTMAIINFNLRPLSIEKDEFNYFEIKKGESTKQISNNLRLGNLIRSSTSFYWWTKLSHTNLQAGHYKISPGMSSKEIMEKFKNGEVDAYSITIPEGYRALQIAKLFKQKTNLDENKFITAAIGTEGTLFPDTYVFPSSSEPEKIIKTMQDNFDKKTADLKLTQDQLILASIVEREAITDDERSKIAAVYMNRVNKGMLLQADPTIRYGLDTQQYLDKKTVEIEFWQPITKADYQNLASPFNTYKSRGLPPAPICNPGIKSIQSAVSVEKDFDYLFFFHDQEQKIHFSRTYGEHLEQIRQYGLP
jgi:UPF0755 protein